jgi:glycosyltransferase involved in cell wall biosynthesis
MIEGLGTLGWTVRTHALDGSFPAPTAAALQDAQQQLDALPAGSLVLIDGLALGAMPEVVRAHADRLRLIGLVHHPLAAETGLSQARAEQLAASERQALRHMRKVVVTSPATRGALAEYGVPWPRIAVVEPGVDKPPKTARPGLSPALHTPLRLLCVATITPRKGHDLLVEALSGLREHAWSLTCVGDLARSPETAGALRTRIAAAGLATRIQLAGELNAAGLEASLREADVFVLATRYEGYGMAVAEAVAHGLPVISTRTGAIPSLVGPDAGLLVAPDDLNALRDALARLFSEPGLCARLAAGARAAAAHLPDWNASSQQLADVLSEVAGDVATGGTLT